jgi:hypothetical protein
MPAPPRRSGERSPFGGEQLGRGMPFRLRRAGASPDRGDASRAQVVAEQDLHDQLAVPPRSSPSARSRPV